MSKTLIRYEFLFDNEVFTDKHQLDSLLGKFFSRHGMAAVAVGSAYGDVWELIKVEEKAEAVIPKKQVPISSTENGFASLLEKARLVEPKPINKPGKPNPTKTKLEWLVAKKRQHKKEVIQGFISRFI